MESGDRYSRDRDIPRASRVGPLLPKRSSTWINLLCKSLSTHRGDGETGLPIVPPRLSSTILASVLALRTVAGYFRAVLDWFRSHPRAPRIDLETLVARLDVLERKEAVRAAEWQDTLDRFERLYKRLVARQQREGRHVAGQDQTATPGDPPPVVGESPLSLRRRLRGG